MINKQNIFASAGQQAQGYGTTQYVTGMVPNTIAMAEDVNSFGNTLDKELGVVCNEIANVITSGVLDKDGGDGEALNAADNAQLLTALRNMSNGFTQTGIIYDGVQTLTTPTQNGTSGINFGGAIRIMFNQGGYFGNSAAKMQIGTIAANTSWTITNTEPTGVRFLYAELSGGAVLLKTKEKAPDGSSGATECMLGSFFVIDNNGTKQIQANSWKFQPWLQNTSAINRESPTAQTKGGLLTANTGTTLNMGTLEIKAEGINFGLAHQEPNIMKKAAGSFTYKFLYPGYDPSASDLSALDTTHLYNTTAATWDDVSAQTTKFMVMVPCIIPTGQTCMIPAMSAYDANTGTYAALFNSIEEATAAVYGLHYTDSDVDTTRNRAIYLGYSIVVRVGSTDLTNQNDFAIVGMLPQELDGFTYAGGQTGGGTGTYTPMPVIKISNNNAFEVRVNTKTIVVGNSAQIQVTLPPAQSGILNQLEIEYVHNANYGGLNITNTTWWDAAPELEAGKLYLFISEYTSNGWKTGWLSTSVQ